MVRSISKTTTSSSDDDLVVELFSGMIKATFHLVRAGLIALRLALAFPMISVPLVICIWLASVTDSSAGVALAIAFGVGALIWRYASPTSFKRLVSGPVWKRWRSWTVYRRPWAQLCALHGLTAVLNDRVLVPPLYRVQVGFVSDVVTVRMLYGQSVTDWAKQSDALAHAFGAIGVRVRSSKPGWVVMEVHHGDSLAAPIPLPRPEASSGIDLEAVPVGMTETGRPWRLRVLGRHVLVAGATGAGKGSVVWSTLAALGPAIKEGVVQVWVIDPKGGMEFGRGQALFARFAHDAGDGALELLRDATDVLVARANRLRGITRLHTPSVAEPLILLVIDEIATLTAYVGDRKRRAELDQLLGLVLSQGRAVGVSVMAAVQDPSKEVIGLRQLFPTRIALRLVEASQANMVLGDGARDRGALCDMIPEHLPGVGYVCEEGSAELIRVRAHYVSDADIDRLVHAFTPEVPEQDTGEAGQSWPPAA
jgi:S-DNA-T family DNA segregation ATPase FtsK/SpoIIIE